MTILTVLPARFAAAILLLVVALPATAQPLSSVRLEHLPANAAGAVMGRRVLGPTGEEMGRVVNVLVDTAGNPVAAVVDFGGFLGVGVHRVAVGWSLLGFTIGKTGARISIDIAPEVIASSPEYRPGEDAEMLQRLAP